MPGTVLARRYRIVSLLGKGGMGEVYRAEDLKLDQEVALKFLPEEVAKDGASLARFHREVRIARQVSHRNVCRVFDIGDADGVPFLTMEYVDGEDLASLLRRIGRFSQDRGIEIARQICAGLAAAHEFGVLHRDLKPANIMVDAKGRVRITDFGLAGLVHSFPAEDIRAGTPAYMAPEQLFGAEVNFKSDIYSLGLVLYEIFTGSRVFRAVTIGELLIEREQSSPASPSSLVRDLDPVVERVILRCLEQVPGQRPVSALQVSAALPGGDALAAALAAGETPSPEMVAAAEVRGATQPLFAWSIFGATLTALAALFFLARYSLLLNLTPLDRTPDVLTDHAQEITRRLGYPDQPADTYSMIGASYRELRYRAVHQPSPERVRALAAADPSPLRFTYFQSPSPLVPTGVAGDVTERDVSQTTPGTISIFLDARGRLLFFQAIPPESDFSNGPWPQQDWSALFAEARLDPNQFTPTADPFLPPVPFDQRAVWQGTLAGDKYLVKAAAYHGKPVYFELFPPWSSPQGQQRVSGRIFSPVRDITFVVIALSLLAAGCIIARRNIRLGRGDRRGAFRVSAVMLLVTMLGWLLGTHHVRDLVDELSLLQRCAGFGLFLSACVWLTYMALEPYMRRQWPELLISWTRLLAGGWKDPVVGRDFLFGALFGVLYAIPDILPSALPSRMNISGLVPWFDYYGTRAALGTLNQVLALACSCVRDAIWLSFGGISLLFLARAIFRKKSLAALVTFLVGVPLNFQGENLTVGIFCGVISSALAVFVLVRYGLLAHLVAITCNFLILHFPVTLDFSRWYVARSICIDLAVVSLAFYGLRRSVGSRPPFGTAPLGS